MINVFLRKMIGLEFIRTKPRESIRFAKKYFNDKEIKVIEIGVYDATNTTEMLDNLNINKLFLIDPYEEYVDYTTKQLGNAKAKAHLKLDEYRSTGWEIKWVEQKSEDAAICFITESIDFIYIDGGHDYDSVKRDLEMYWGKVAVGGILAGHDIECPDVSDAVLDFASKNKLSVLFGERRDWWIIK